MTRERLRPAHNAATLAQLYAAPHQHTRWADHRLRVAVTTQVAQALPDITSVADLSCGDAAIASSTARAAGADRVVLGDYAPGYEHQGPIEETIHRIDPVDLYICSETLEHLDDPDTVLTAIRGKTRHLVLSTPIDAWGDPNPEHYWAWSREGIEAMLRTAGFTDVDAFCALDFRPAGLAYCFGIWAAR